MTEFKVKIINISVILLLLGFAFPYSAPAELQNRIISLSPSTTEIIYALNLEDRLVGVTTYCDYPEKAKKKPKVGAIVNPSVEAIVDLKPDAVILSTELNTKETAERIDSLGIKTYIFKAKRLDELPGAIRELGSFLSVKQKAEEIAIDLEGKLKKYKGIPKSRKKILFIIWPEPLMVAGPGTVIDDAITLLGAENIASKAKTPFPKYSIEEVIRQGPDVIFIGKGHTDMRVISGSLLKRVASVPAVKNGAVFYINDSLYRLGPRVIEGIEEMARCLQ